MKIRFNVTGAKRKALAQAVAEILGEDYRYLGVPTFAYAFDYFIIDREGTLVCDDRTDEGKIGELVSGLAERGFEASVTAGANNEEEATAPQQEAEEEEAATSQQETEEDGEEEATPQQDVEEIVAAGQGQQRLAAGECDECLAALFLPVLQALCPIEYVVCLHNSDNYNVNIKR